MKLEVLYKDSQKVGTLAEDSKGRVYFEYDTDWLKTGIQLSPIHLELQRGLLSHSARGSMGLYGLFEDSLPDMFSMTVLNKRFSELGITPTTLSLLAYIGDRGMGALSYRPSTYEGDLKESDRLDLDALTKLACKVLEKCQVSDSLDELYAHGVVAGGIKPKVICSLNVDKTEIAKGFNRLEKGFEHWIVKLDTEKDESTRVEYAYSLMARDAGLDVPETCLLQSRHGTHFGIKRFDRRGDEKLHTQTLDRIADMPAASRHYDYDDYFRVIRAVTGSQEEINIGFRQMVFNVLSHNHDDHTKNFSFRMDDKGGWSLAPSYDLTYNQSVEHHLGINRKYKDIGQDDMIELAEVHSVPGAQNVIDEVACVIEEWGSYAERAELSEQATEHITSSINSGRLLSRPETPKTRKFNKTQDGQRGRGI